MTIEHVSSLGGYEAGDTVRIVGERGRYRVRGASRSERSPEGWLDLFGGTPGREAYRAVRPESVALVTPRGPGRLPIPGLEGIELSRSPTRRRGLRAQAALGTEASEQSALF